MWSGLSYCLSCTYSFDKMYAHWLNKLNIVIVMRRSKTITHHALKHFIAKECWGKNGDSFA